MASAERTEHYSWDRTERTERFGTASATLTSPQTEGCADGMGARPTNRLLVANASTLEIATGCKRELLSRLVMSRMCLARGLRFQAAPSLLMWMLRQSGSNVVGLGWGAKTTSGLRVDGRAAVRVYVRRKLSLSSLSPIDRIPGEVCGVPTDVIEVGSIYPLCRPTLCGVSVGREVGEPGTLGCLVTSSRHPSENPYILSNNHVLADCNRGMPGDLILHPCRVDGGDPRNPIARLTEFAPLCFGPQENSIDAAIARVVNADEVTPQILAIGPVQSGALGLLEERRIVHKYGSATGYTRGSITDLFADPPPVKFAAGDAVFCDQLAIEGLDGNDFGKPGDSGSLVIDEATGYPVGLLFARAENGTAFANRIDDVLRYFDAAIL